MTSTTEKGKILTANRLRDGEVVTADTGDVAQPRERLDGRTGHVGEVLQLLRDLHCAERELAELAADEGGDERLAEGERAALRLLHLSAHLAHLALHAIRRDDGFPGRLAEVLLELGLGEAELDQQAADDVS